jgi:glucose/mannose transport system substrate-binding protein
MQWHLGVSLKALAAAGLLDDVQMIADAERWDSLLPSLLADNAKYNGRYVAIPVNIHGENWLWWNPSVFAASGAAPPRDWDEFNVAAEKIRRAGYIPLALGGQGWQQLIVFDAVLLGVGGVEFYRKALVELDPEALSSVTMVRVFEQLRRIKGMTDIGSVNRDWNEATNLVITGKAGMLFMGDWAKAEFSAAGLEPGSGFGCELSPGAGNAYVILVDALAVPRVHQPRERQGQLLLATVAFDPMVQRDFSRAKGSIPARTDIAPDGFDVCSRKALALVHGAGELLPAVGSSMSIAAFESGAVTDAVSLFFARDMTAVQGAKALRDAVEATR